MDTILALKVYIPSPQDAKSVTVSLPNVGTETLNALSIPRDHGRLLGRYPW